MEKKEVRKIVFARRKALSEDQLVQGSRAIFDQVRRTRLYREADTVFAYMDYKNEVMTRGFIRACMEDGKRVAVPRVEGKEMTFIHLVSEDQLGPGCMGIMEPIRGESMDDCEEALIIVPGVAFDLDRHRVGYGGGFYDRYLEIHTQHPTIAVALDIQIFDQVPFEEFDRKPDILVTETRLLHREDLGPFDRPAAPEKGAAGPEEKDRRTPIPEEEPARQYYFIETAKRLLREKEEALGRRLTFCVTTFGCQMNARDSEKLSGILEAIGYLPSPQESEEADLVIYNTCTVRENANTKVYGRLGRLHSYKKKNPHMLIALCGCMMQEQGVVEKLQESFRFVDLVFGTHNLYRFAELLAKAMVSDRMVVEIVDKDERIVEELPIDRKYPFKSGVNIMFGCNNFCTYCIVPYVRGRERSRAPEDILAEIRSLADDGVREIMLLGQNVNSYGKTLAEPVSFAEILEEICRIEGLDRVRFMTSHPKDLSDDLIRVMAENPKICRHLHLPLQSGSSRILKKMNRRYTKEDYLGLVDRIRSAMPDICLTTDIIVGFPGETEEDFQETMDVVEQVRYDSAFTFIYSKRSGTPAAEMASQIPEEVIQDRFDRLLQRVQTLAKERTARFRGQVREVLVEAVNEQDPSLLTGRLDTNTLVHFPGHPALIGQLASVRLDTCHGFYYSGTLV